MIFVTVGTQLPFDRLVSAIDQWARKQINHNVFAQIGPSDKKPGYIQWANFLSPGEFREKVNNADLIVSHAGIGSLITALQTGKPIVIMPRRSELNEHRNDHQIATANRFRDKLGVYAVFDEEDLVSKLDHIETISFTKSLKPYADKNLLDHIKKFIWE